MVQLLLFFLHMFYICGVPQLFQLLGRCCSIVLQLLSTVENVLNLCLSTFLQINIVMLKGLEK
jgi:hypothetical protein